jgi:hypothetical protein
MDFITKENSFFSPKRGSVKKAAHIREGRGSALERSGLGLRFFKVGTVVSAASLIALYLLATPILGPLPSTALAIKVLTDLGVGAAALALGGFVVGGVSKELRERRG